MNVQIINKQELFKSEFKINLRESKLIDNYKDFIKTIIKDIVIVVKYKTDFPTQWVKMQKEFTDFDIQNLVYFNETMSNVINEFMKTNDIHSGTYSNEQPLVVFSYLHNLFSKYHKYDITNFYYDFYTLPENIECQITLEELYGFLENDFKNYLNDEKFEIETIYIISSTKFKKMNNPINSTNIINNGQIAGGDINGSNTVNINSIIQNTDQLTIEQKKELSEILKKENTAQLKEFLNRVGAHIVSNLLLSFLLPSVAH